MLTNAIIGQYHKDYPEGLAFKFNTEFREQFQMTPLLMKNFGIDRKRYRCVNTNRPEAIFDFIEKEIAGLCEKGAQIKLIVIDSITDVMGRRMQNADTVETQQMGDDAATIKDGLKRIKSVCKRFGITLLMVAQERSVLDPVEQMRGKKTKMAGAFYLQHFAEYFVYVAPNEAKEGKSDVLGTKFEDDSITDIMGNAETVAKKIKVQMKKNSIGVAGRTGEFTFHTFNGIMNTHEEVFRLGVARNVLEMPNNRTYILKNFPSDGLESKWVGKEECLMNVQANDELYKEIIKRVKLKDIDMFKNGVMEDKPGTTDITNSDISA